MKQPTYAKKLQSVLITLVLVAFAPLAQGQTTASAAPTVYERDDVKALMKRVMGYQLNAYGERRPVNWQAGAFWAGVSEAYRATDDPAFNEAAKTFGEAAEWRLNVGRAIYHADSIAIGMLYLDLYAKDKDPDTIAHLKPVLERYASAKTIGRGEVGRAPNVREGAPFTGRHVFWWCDALFMGPPVFAKMAAVTGDQKWLDLLHSLYWDSVAFLYDPAEGLFYRDSRYFFDKQKSPTGKKIFWSRGNGWVYGGLILVVDALPKDDPHRDKYIDLFRQMTTAIVKYQGEDGMWRPSLNEPTWFNMPESSGTAFFCYGLLAGINRGWLDRETYLPIALRAWAGLTSLISEDGKLGYAQKEAGSPGKTDANTVRDYGHGAFLLAASELYKMNLSAKDITRMKKP